MGNLFCTGAQQTNGCQEKSLACISILATMPGNHTSRTQHACMPMPDTYMSIVGQGVAVCSSAHWSASVAVPPTMRQPKRSTILSRFTSLTKSRRGGWAGRASGQHGVVAFKLNINRLHTSSALAGMLERFPLACVMQKSASSGLRLPGARS